MLATGLNSGVSVVKFVGFLDSCEDRLQGVVVGLADGIELVIVAAGTMRGRTCEGRHDCGHDVIAIDVPTNLPIDRVLTNAGQRAFVPWPTRQQSQSRSQLQLIRIQGVGCDLLFDKSSVRFVSIERIDHVVAVWPGILARAVLVVAMRLGKVNQVEPVPCPAFAILR